VRVDLKETIDFRSLLFDTQKPCTDEVISSLYEYSALKSLKLVVSDASKEVIEDACFQIADRVETLELITPGSIHLPTLCMWLQFTHQHLKQLKSLHLICASPSLDVLQMIEKLSSRLHITLNGKDISFQN
jgi:hypothetical protein